MVRPMRVSSVSFGPDLRISLKPVIVVLVVFGVALSWVSEYLPSSSDRLHVQFLFMLLFAVSAIGWILDGWRTRVGRWFTIIALAVLIHLGNVWLDSPALLTLLTIPIPLASALISLPAASATAAVANPLPQYLRSIK